MAAYKLATNVFGKYWVPESAFPSYTGQAILAGNVHEYETINYIRQNPGNGAIVHAGTGFGDFLPALKHLQNPVYAFEPNAEMYSATIKTIKENEIDNVILFKEGLSNSISDTRNFLHDGIRSEVNPMSTDYIHVTTLDSVIPGRVSLIHLDIEGHEFEALEGASQIIEDYSPTIILEIDKRAVDYNNFMWKNFKYQPMAQLIHNCGPMVFVNTVYKKFTSL
jgi:FkbM family methyltransferase